MNALIKYNKIPGRYQISDKTRGLFLEWAWKYFHTTHIHICIYCVSFFLLSLIFCYMIVSSLLGWVSTQSSFFFHWIGIFAYIYCCCWWCAYFFYSCFLLDANTSSIYSGWGRSGIFLSSKICTGYCCLSSTNASNSNRLHWASTKSCSLLQPYLESTECVDEL